MPTLNERQTRLLLMPVQESRVGKNAKGFSHLQAWDVRRTLTRVFGFTGWSEEILEETLVSERHVPNGKDSYGNDKFRHTVVYRAKVRLTVYDTDGNRLSFWDGSAAGDATNLPSLGDAHDFALKTALSQALKRAAHNLGDQFGLSLYNNGSTLGQVQWSMAYPPAGQQADTTPVPAVNDEPVQADPEDAAVEQQMYGAPEPTVTRSPEVVNGHPTMTPDDGPAPELAHVSDLALVNAMSSGHPEVENDASEELRRREVWSEAKAVMITVAQDKGWNGTDFESNFRQSFGHSVNQGTIEEFTYVTKMLGESA
jgi:recombination DNA repair RAD52 pathway protein